MKEEPYFPPTVRKSLRKCCDDKWVRGYLSAMKQPETDAEHRAVMTLNLIVFVLDALDLLDKENPFDRD